jgi:ribokinase
VGRMAIFNLGSINIDHFYQVPHLPSPGETLSATGYSVGLGGKGANQSVAAALAGAITIHIGAIGNEGQWTVARMQDFGVETDHVAALDNPTAHAIINVDPQGENAIVICSSANVQQDEKRIEAAFEDATASDFCVLQNETNLVRFTAELAQRRGLRVVYSAAPFEAERVAEVLPFIDMLVLNEVEAGQLSKALGTAIEDLPVKEILVTKGSKGAIYQSADGSIEVPAFDVEPVDTTGAGDTYLGFFIAGLDAGMDVKGAMTFAAAGSAIQVTRHGTAEAIPNLAEVKTFLEERL